MRNRLSNRLEKVPRFRCIVNVVVVKRPVQTVRSAFQRNRHRSAAREALFGGGAIGHDVHIFDCFGGGNETLVYSTAAPGKIGADPLDANPCSYSARSIRRKS